MEMDQLQNLPRVLLPWYQNNKRDLPWRIDRQPYHVWVSEIMLQQTRVEAVKGYYSRFLKALPDIESLACCDEDALYKLWEGLGYYSRVRNLQKAAQVILRDYGGVFPRDYSAVRALPGIGDYTAGAICSICFDQRVPAVDGNVMRVISRLTADDTPIDLPAAKGKVQELLKTIYPAEAGDFTQSLMELGATLCGPNKAPECEKCPCKDLCKAYLTGKQKLLPVRLPKKGKRTEQLTVFILSCGGSYALEKRPGTGLLAGLWQFPNVKGHLTTEQMLATVKSWGLVPKDILRQLERSHIFTHIRWDMQGVYLEVESCNGDFDWFTAEAVEKQAALPTAFRQFWEVLEYV